MKIRSKLFILLGTAVVALMVAGSYAFYSIYDQTQLSQELARKQDVQTEFKELQYYLAGYSNDERAYLLTGRKEFKTELADKKRRIQELEKKLFPLLDAKTKKTAERGLTGYFNSSTRAVQAYDGGGKELAMTVHFGDESSIRKDVLNPVIEKMVQTLHKDIEIQKQKNKTNMTIQMVVFAVVLLLLIVGGLVFGSFIVASIVRPIGVLHQNMKEIAEGKGDLTKSVKLGRKDELGQLSDTFDQFTASLRTMIMQISETTSEVAASSQQLTASAEQNSHAASQVTLSIQQIASNTEVQTEKSTETSQMMEQTVSQLEVISENAILARDLTSAASEQADEGQVHVNRTHDQMKDIVDSVDTAQQGIEELNAQSESIGEIVTIITEIANQTNLLALNASIEAARAGESGKGFAVVASEVRKLAEQSGKSAQSISDLVKKIQEGTHNSSESVKMVRNNVFAGLTVVKETEKQFQNIQSSTKEVNQQIMGITGSIAQLAKGSERLSSSSEIIAAGARESSGSVQSIAAATEEQLASMEEIAASAHSLSFMAEELQKMISKFKI
ncbi:methyl-accepting chemotaxis protein [Fictibacillus solisalsi]|uniref:Methyl-accepting chemotaxis protein n=1 Tax=Fictibacillus solisalsi TaxID=459525 RepID=A0A1G9TEW3_9BACL|nr:methyl-accepting chemotaxis protein [Fictibacillus solisalsi]SDM45685.1 methyl-accepting chemotaxis protein [Fictibacillus solisalsi]